MRGLLLGALTALLCSATRYDPIPGKPDGGSASSPAGSDAAQAGSSCLRDTRSGFAPLCSFASAFAQRDLQTQAGRANFMDLAVAAEAKFHSPGLSYDAATGLTYDGHTVDAVTGELSGGPRLWSSAGAPPSPRFSLLFSSSFFSLVCPQLTLFWTYIRSKGIAPPVRPCSGAGRGRARRAVRQRHPPCSRCSAGGGSAVPEDRQPLAVP